ncbi:hypothetical protein EI42_02430 [Thermosporothrix hazakensis]|uniref:Uncharacterized protein n=2 Tax=Thermosporothrix TaxID=768650 RepID=A0A326U8T3_THEHA|nr:hypothetical protein [Thermosporothrix hazakensis]PZW30462.1 hypothetical protein EI42_02430 [Thermosporothrix hazakensis]BBH91177.1 hypothetical protein KTC_59280 [Thermosporothrix sp. COM3]GCE49322.1 hypothetical protein KTH_41910 [Thermosporothrix hazakensis]
MGVERAVTRWYVERQMILDEIAALEAKKAAPAQEDGAVSEQADSAELEEQLKKAREKFRLLGPCPKPMMG